MAGTMYSLKPYFDPNAFPSPAPIVYSLHGHHDLHTPSVQTPSSNSTSAATSAGSSAKTPAKASASNVEKQISDRQRILTADLKKLGVQLQQLTLHLKGNNAEKAATTKKEKNAPPPQSDNKKSQAKQNAKGGGGGGAGGGHAQVLQIGKSDIPWAKVVEKLGQRRSVKILIANGAPTEKQLNENAVVFTSGGNVANRTEVWRAVASKLGFTTTPDGDADWLEKLNAALNSGAATDVDELARAASRRLSRYDYLGGANYDISDFVGSSIIADWASSKHVPLANNVELWIARVQRHLA